MSRDLRASLLGEGRFPWRSHLSPDEPSLFLEKRTDTNNFAWSGRFLGWFHRIRNTAAASLGGGEEEPWVPDHLLFVLVAIGTSSLL